MAIIQPLKKLFNWETAHERIQDAPLYHLDWALTDTVEINSWRGIIDISNFNGLGEPAAAFGTTRTIKLTGPQVASTREQFYVQLTPYYSFTQVNDNVIPYVVPVGLSTPGVSDINIYNANPAVAGANNWTGHFYIYFELGVNYAGK